MEDEDLGRELDIAEAAEEFLDCVVRDRVWPPQVGERLVLNRH